MLYICTIWNLKNKGGCYMWSKKGGYIYIYILYTSQDHCKRNFKLMWHVYFSFLVFVWCSIGTFVAILEWWSSVELDAYILFAMHWRNFAIPVEFRVLKHNTNTFKFDAIISKLNWNSSIPCFTCVFWMSSCARAGFRIDRLREKYRRHAEAEGKYMSQMQVVVG